LIFITVGTHQDSFPRMLAAVEALPQRAEAIVQYGPGRPPEGVARAEAFMSFAEMEANFAAADAVITHAGVGSILCARRAGHVPVVVPRYHELGEHVDDHQVELTKALAGRGEVEPVWRDETLAAGLARLGDKRTARTVGPPGDLIAAVRAALLGG
jgi:UDP-N-acetylglucosamine transferase subunit ALG13